MSPLTTEEKLAADLAALETRIKAMERSAWRSAWGWAAAWLLTFFFAMYMNLTLRADMSTEIASVVTLEGKLADATKAVQERQDEMLTRLVQLAERGR